MKKNTQIFITIALSALLLRLALSPLGTLALDQGTFIAWSSSIFSDGFSKFYLGWSDYLPGYLYVLWLLKYISVSIPFFDPTILYKLPAIVVDLATGILIYRVVGGKKGLWVSAAYLFNPAIFANSSLWGQVDSFTALFSVLSLALFKTSIPLSAVSFALGFIVKPQAVFILPIIAVLLIKKRSVVHLVSWSAVSLSVLLLAFLPFWSESGNFFQFVAGRLGMTLNQYPYTSINAFNFWGVYGMWQDDMQGIIPLKFIGYIISIFVGLIWAVRQRKLLFKNDTGWIYWAASVLFLTSFIFFTRIHERHMLPVLAPLAIASAAFPVLWIPYAILSATYVANLWYAYVWISQDFKSVFSPEFIQVIGIINVFSLFILVFADRLNIPEKVWKIGKLTNTFSFPKTSLTKRNIRAIFAIVFLFAFGIRLLQLQEPANEYFDEVYHAFTARRMMHADPGVWEWWSQAPEGFAYEWTHPPLAKIAMVGGMSIFGENSFGWRFPALIAGMVSIIFVYAIGKHIFEDEWAAVLAATVYSLDGLSFVSQRIGMNDAYLVCFSLGALYFLLKEKYIVSAVFLGLALSSKWSALWVIPILILAFILLKKQKKWTLLSFIIIPPIVYLLTYTGHFLTGHDWETFIGMQKQMWWYHTGLVAEHPYTSLWYSWPMMLRPVWLYTNGFVDGRVANIYMMGNPFVLWSGLVSVVMVGSYALLRRHSKLLFISASYCLFFVPWALSPRIMFLYHYLPSLPFLALCTAYLLRKNSSVALSFVLVSLIVFLYFYPHLSGLPVPVWLDSSYYWLTSWK